MHGSTSLARFVDGAGHFAWLRIDDQGRLALLRGDALQRVGMSSPPRIGLDIARELQEADPPGAFAAALARTRGGQACEVTLRWRGESFHVSLRTSGASDPGGVDLLLVHQPRVDDGSSEALLALMNQVAGMMYRCRNDEAWTMDLVSDGCMALTGYSVAELRGNAVVAYGDLVHPDDVDWLWAKCQTNLDNRRFCSNKYRIFDANGAQRWVWDRAQGVYSPEGELLFIEGLVTDITADKEAEAARDALQAQLLQSQKMQVVGQLAGGIAHDFNNLLQVIDANLDLASGHPPGSQAWRDDVAEARRAVVQASQLTEQLLTFGRRTPTRPVPLLAWPMVEEQVAFLRRVIPASVALSVTGDAPRDVRVLADETGLRQILSNLCLNARDVMPRGGDLTLHLGLQTVDEGLRGMYPWAKADAYVTIDVCDTGEGMSEATMQQVFEPFFTTKGPGKGTGLGLSTVYSLAASHGGGVTVDSELGQGSTFRLWLPATDHPARATTPAAEVAAPLSGRGTILVVDDQRAVLSVVVRFLEEAGYEVLSATGGAEGLGLVVAHAGEIDLVLMDAIMPEMSGQQAAQAIRKVCPSLPVVFTTGYGGEGAAQGFGDCEVLCKPYSRDQLLRCVGQVMAGASR